MLHVFFMSFFVNYLSKRKINFAGMLYLKRNELVSNIFKNDHIFKAELRGLIIGHFTLEEYKDYQPMATEANRRILTMSKERLLSVFIENNKNFT